MRKLSLILGFMALLAAAPAGAQSFLAASEDLPLPPGMSEMVGSGLSFDSPSGRIVEAYARGTVLRADALAFYAATLPQLGWTRESDTVYRRDDEVLRLTSQDEGQTLVLHFTISPE